MILVFRHVYCGSRGTEQKRNKCVAPSVRQIRVGAAFIANKRASHCNSNSNKSKAYHLALTKPAAVTNAALKSCLSHALPLTHSNHTRAVQRHRSLSAPHHPPPPHPPHRLELLIHLQCMERTASLLLRLSSRV